LARIIICGKENKTESINPIKVDSSLKLPFFLKFAQLIAQTSTMNINKFPDFAFRANVKWLGAFFCAALISFLLFKVAGIANEKYYERWPLQGDTMSYWSRDIALSKIPVPNVALPSRLTQAQYAAKLNPRDPIRTIFFGLLPADAISSINAHLYFSAITAFLFLLMLVIVLERRTGSLIFALGAPLVTLLPSGLLSPMYGLPSRLPDIPASFLLGAALFAAFSGKNSRKSELTWIFIAGLLLGFATLARYQLWIYGLFIIGPIVFLFGMRRYFSEGKQARDLMLYPLALISGLGILAGQFILTYTTQVFQFYAVAGYGLNSTMLTSLKTTGIQFLDYLGLPAALAGTLILTGLISTRYKACLKSCKWDKVSILWALISYPILLFIVMRVESIVEQTYYIVPGLLIFLLSPFCWEADRAKNTGFNIFSVCLILILPLAVIGKINGYLTSESFLYPREGEIKLSKFQGSLAELVAVNIPVMSNSRSSTIDSNFFYYSRIIELIARNRFNRDASSLMIFQIRQSQWKINFTGEEGTDKSLIMQDLKDRIDIFMALTKPLAASKESTFVDDYTGRLAEFVNHELAANPTLWEKRGTVNGPFGEVTVYKNLTRE
jgi:NADH:ubiquinone oxidoreductase subunit 6 (subunit J)